MATVRITITKEGKITREAIGFKGEGCLKKTAFLDDVFGTAETEELKDSYYEQSEVISDGLPSGWCG